jgi:hypothetical protein
MEVTRRTLLRTTILGATAATALPFGIRPANAWNCEPTVYQLRAGQTIDVGNLKVWNDSTNLYVQYNLTGGWKFCDHSAPDESVKLWVGTNLANLPKNSSGNPVPGQFPYKGAADGLTTWTFTIPLADAGITDVSEACDQHLYIVAHADVCVGDDYAQTAWGGNSNGKLISGTRWWYYADYLICCDLDEEPFNPVCETAFAKGSRGITFVWTTEGKSNPENLPTLGLTKNRWGWAINLTSPTATAGITLDLWAGAGLNNTSKGSKVGTVTVIWDGTTLTVTYDLISGYRLSETHLYAGDNAPDTIAPGQYGNLHYFSEVQNVSSDQYILPLENDSSGSLTTNGIWIVAHAVVCTVKT